MFRRITSTVVSERVVDPRSVHLALTVLLGTPVMVGFSAVTDAHNPRLAAQCGVIVVFMLLLMFANSRRTVPAADF